MDVARLRLRNSAIPVSVEIRVEPERVPPEGKARTSYGSVTLLPDPSRISTVGCGARGWPLCAPPG